MPVIELFTEINAPVERVFDLARSIDLHKATMNVHREEAIGGVTEGLINAGETVTWRATHFGVRQNLTSLITICARPRHFQDVMVKGAFKSFTHDHFFDCRGESVLMRDVFDYKSPLGILGKMADVLFLQKYMTAMLEERNLLIKKVAENDDWRKFIR